MWSEIVYTDLHGVDAYRGNPQRGVEKMKMTDTMFKAKMMFHAGYPLYMAIWILARKVSA
jgi:hypothetical protein